MDAWPIDGLVAAFSAFGDPGEEGAGSGFVVGVSRVGMVVLGEGRTPVRCSVGQFRKLEVEGAPVGEVGRQGTQGGSAGTPDNISVVGASS